MSIRLNKYLSELGICSRREADRWIEAGRVSINDVIAQIGDKVTEEDVVLVDGNPIQQDNTFIYMVLNKPAGITSTTDQKDPTNIIDFVKAPKRVFHIGRLDKDSEGLILLTNDGDIVNKILRSDNQHDKEYIVTVEKPITKDFVQAMSSGIPILNTITKPCNVKQLNKTQFKIILTEGMNRQIRRMCSYLGYRVVHLNRVRIMNITNHQLPLGKWRYLSKEEVATLKELTRDSSKTA